MLNPSTSVRPVCAGVLSSPKWKDLSVQRNAVTLSGGRSSKVFTLSTFQVTGTGGQLEHFVTVSKRFEWFIKIVGGDKCSKGELAAVKIVDLIRSKLEAFNASEYDDVAVAEHDNLASVEETDDADMLDRMNQLGPSTQVDEAPDQSRDRATNSSKRARVKSHFRQIITLRMPLQPPCATTDSAVKELRLFRGGRTGQTVSVAVTDLPWLLSFAADELHFQGVDAVAEDMEPPRTGNVEHIPHLLIEWNFHKKLWLAEFVAGPCAHVKRYFSPTKQLDPARWAHMQQKQLIQDAHAFDPTQLKEVSKAFVIAWCDAISRNKEPDFISAWGPDLNQPC